MCIPKKLRGICWDEGVRVRLTGFSARTCAGPTAKSADKAEAKTKRVRSMMFISGSSDLRADLCCALYCAGIPIRQESVAEQRRQHPYAKANPSKRPDHCCLS